MKPGPQALLAALALFLITAAAPGSDGSFVPSKDSTGVLLTNYASAPPALKYASSAKPKTRAAAKVTEGLLPGQCQSLPPNVPVPGGGECVALGCRARRGVVVGHVYECPAGWMVQNGQAVPWVMP